MSRTRDLSFMELAFSLAQKGVGRTSPNPCVGAVIVKNDIIVGTGWHEGPGRPHAEIVAIRRAGALTRGSELFLTMEPCVHWGRTPPCLGPVLEAGFSRIVLAGYDPNPIVFRRGATALRRAGVAVEVGLLEKKNRILNESYFKFMESGEPLVTLKAALTMDGRMASGSGDSKWISGPEARDYIHLLRAEHDAVLAGIGTVLRDDPRLTVRHRLWPGKRILRVIVDSRLRFPIDAKMTKTLREGGILIFTGADIPAAKARRLEGRGVEIVSLPCRGRRLPLRPILKELGRRQIQSVLVEGGSAVHSSFLESRAADKVLLSFNPKLLGGPKAPSFYEGRGAVSVRGAIRIKTIRRFELGEDIFLEGSL